MSRKLVLSLIQIDFNFTLICNGGTYSTFHIDALFLILLVRKKISNDINYYVYESL